jgi:hypothetical protein
MKIFKNLLQNQQAKFKVKLGTNYPWMKEIQVCSNEAQGQVLFKGEIITKM